MPLLTQYERTYPAPPAPPKPETEGERKIDPNEDRPFNVGVVDRRGGISRSNNPFVTTANRELWEMGWEHEDEKQRMAEEGITAQDIAESQPPKYPEPQ